MKVYLRYLKMDIIRTIETKRFYFCIFSIIGIGFVSMFEMADMYIDVMYVFGQMMSSMTSILVFFFTAIPCAAIFEEDMENKFYRPYIFRGNRKSYVWAKLTAIFITPIIIFAAGELLFTVIISGWLPWCGDIAGSNLTFGEDRITQYLLGEKKYFIFIICYCVQEGILLGLLNLAAAYLSLYERNRLLIWISPALLFFFLQYLLIYANISDLTLISYFQLTYNTYIWGISFPYFSIGIGILGFVFMGVLTQRKMGRILEND